MASPKDLLDLVRLIISVREKIIGENEEYNRLAEEVSSLSELLAKLENDELIYERFQTQMTFTRGRKHLLKAQGLAEELSRQLNWLEIIVRHLLGMTDKTTNEVKVVILDITRFKVVRSWLVQAARVDNTTLNTD